MRKAQSKKEFETQKKAYYDKLLENPMLVFRRSSVYIMPPLAIMRKTKKTGMKKCWS